MLCYRYALDTIVGGDFLRHNGDQAFNAIKRLIATSSSDNKFESTLENISNKLDILDKNISSMKDVGSMVQELHESAYYRAPEIILEPENAMTNWYPFVKIEINGKRFNAICDMTEFSIIPETIYKSLGLWGLSESASYLKLADNSNKIPLGKIKYVQTKLCGNLFPID